jgi:hypothetical protein
MEKLVLQVFKKFSLELIWFLKLYFFVYFLLLLCFVEVHYGIYKSSCNSQSQHLEAMFQSVGTQSLLFFFFDLCTHLLISAYIV